MKQSLLLISVGLGILFFLNGGFFAWFLATQKNEKIDMGVVIEPTPKPKPLLAYSFDNLSQREFAGSDIEMGEVIEEYNGEEEYSAKLFSFFSDSKKVTGQINIPMTPESKKMPAIIMIRGYVDKEIYRTGIGTNKAAGVLASEGYVTLAPDFFGYGGSDSSSDDVWEDRFNNPVVVLNLIASLESLGFVDTNRVGIWAHSNGGQIALSVLEISGKSYPTTLWAPVTKSFPYSVLYFTDEFSDKGKYLRSEVARLEEDYDVYDFSIDNYLSQIEAPIQLHQGSADDAVPVEWSNEFVEAMEELDKEVGYFVYPGADHNMVGSWNQVVERDLEFFEENL